MISTSSTGESAVSLFWNCFSLHVKARKSRSRWSEHQRQWLTSHLSRLVYNRSGEWRDETVPILASTTVGFTYVTFLMVKVLLWSLKNKMWPTASATSNKIFFFFFSSQTLALFHISLGQQLNLYWVHKVQWVTQVLFLPVTPNKSWHPLCLFCLDRLECWLHCWPLSLVLSLLMTCGAVSGTSYWYHCRLDLFESLFSLLKAASFGWVATKIRYPKRFRTKVSNLRTHCPHLSINYSALRLWIDKNCCYLTLFLYSVHKGWVKSNLIVLFLPEVLLFWSYFCDKYRAQCSFPTLPITNRVPVSHKELLINTLCVMCLCFNRPQHLSCTSEPWQQSPLSAGWSLDMWFAGRDPVRADLCFL